MEVLNIPQHSTNARLPCPQVGVVDAAYRYICDLQAALVHKFSVRGVPQNMQSKQQWRH